MKRFYKKTDLQQKHGNYLILLDDKPVKMPSGSFLTIPDEKLAQKVKEEWDEQQEEILPDTMPLTQILITAHDRVTHERPAIHKSLMAYLDTDLLCYQAHDPIPLSELQQKKWGKWLDWFHKTFEEKLETTTTLQAIKQPDNAFKKVDLFIQTEDTVRFTIIQLVTSLTGSLILALAFINQEIDAEEIFETAFLEDLFKAEIYNENKYGIDPQEEVRRKAFKRDIGACALILQTLQKQAPQA